MKTGTAGMVNTLGNGFGINGIRQHTRMTEQSASFDDRYEGAVETSTSDTMRGAAKMGDGGMLLCAAGLVAFAACCSESMAEHNAKPLEGEALRDALWNA